MHDPFPPQRSPDGRIEVRFMAFEARMSHWILEPVVIRTRDGKSVLSLDGTEWDGGGIPPSFPQPGRVELHLRHYPDGQNVHDLVVDIEAERCWLSSSEEDSRRAADALELLKPAFERQVHASAHRYLLQGLCPHCKARLYLGWLQRLRGVRRVRCEVCERAWTLPKGVRL
ncbi:MAG: hypothetical protein ACR2G3_01170 [Solirubrobacterales bacterium]